MIEPLNLSETRILRSVKNIGLEPAVDAAYVLKIVQKVEEKLNEVIEAINDNQGQF